MTPLIVAAALSLLALDSSPATSQPTTVAPAQVSGSQKSSANDDLDKVVCHREALTGSRFEKRVCMTKAQWDERQRQTDDFERRLGEHPNAPMQGGLSGN